MRRREERFRVGERNESTIFDLDTQRLFCRVGSAQDDARERLTIGPGHPGT